MDRRFDRARYDALVLVAAFGGRVRDETDPSRVAAELAAAVHDTLRPGMVALWLRE